ncbi:hypothetical protein BGW39_011297 [Mortierella sp. 14UC]|nr:hypothetical protein BGW39_011297 [Mortierella sp. 14UC]
MDAGSQNSQAKASDATSASTPVLPPVHLTREELMHMHAKDLLQILDERHIDHTAVVEKPDIVNLILDRCTH